MFPVVTSPVRGRDEFPLKHQTCVYKRFQAPNICLTPREIQSKYGLVIVWLINVKTSLLLNVCRTLVHYMCEIN